MIRSYTLDSVLPSPDSPPGMTSSKSSKTSSFHSDDGSVLADIGHFEEIGLNDDNTTTTSTSSSLKSPPIYPLGPPATSRRTSLSPKPPSTRSLAANKRPLGPTPRRSLTNLQPNPYSANPRSTNLHVLSEPRSLSLKPRESHSTPSLPPLRRHRSTSPGLSLNPRDPNLPPRPRRRSWQANRTRKSFAELEHECDEDDGDDIPDGLVLDNVPISPRAPHERPPSRATSISPSPERSPKERTKSAGNGTPAIAQAHGSLRSPTWKAEAAQAEKQQHRPNALNLRVQSWNSALADLSPEAKALTEKLEEHADQMEEQHSRRPNTWNAGRASADHFHDKREKTRSTPELPPLRRTNIMIDPLPISKEKEAVLSRTRPSWLPPKDPAEERRHLREYQKMMAASAKASERREAARRAKTESKDAAASNLMQIWDKDIIPRWNEAVRERRTRELWWKGVAPRSRGVVWAQAIGNELGLSASSFRAALSRARELEERVKAGRGDAEDVKRAKWFEQIRRDARERTLTDLRIFQQGGPLHQDLIDVLSAYAMYRNDIGYAPTCNTIAALLLLNLPGPDATFISLANLLNRPLPLSFYTSDLTAQGSAYNLVLQTLGQKSPTLHQHLTKKVEDADPEVYLSNLFMTLFTGQLAVDEAARLLDVYVFEGDAILVRAAVAYLLSREMSLLGTKTIDEVVSVMTSGSDRAAPATSGMGAEDRFMNSVREAGKV
ncbi:TBC domain-containing protein [Paramyrothecium foliicola]|nr:TBC domain-containing protein [Paramyrothecium foliicola]